MESTTPVSLPKLALAASLAFFSACSSNTPVEEPSSKSVVSPAQEIPIAETKKGTEKSDPAPSWRERYAELLNKYVTSNGVRYAAWKADSDDLAALKEVVEAIASASPKEATLPFYLNAYNAWILNNVLEDYPVSGVGGGNALGRAAFFGGNRITVAGQKTSFNDLENEIIRKEFDEPRIHFALNCASAGCPPLMSRPFRASTLDADLSRLTRAFVDGNPEGVRKNAEGRYSLSEIFTWFKDDFGDVLAFINRHRTDPIPAGAKITSHDYDWSLNDAK